MFVFIVVLLGWVTLPLAGTEHSAFGRDAKAVLVCGVSVLDAYTGTIAI